MLDYDAMRSKVKKLVEKPDKDPSKLPRAEKETEMVMTAGESIRDSSIFYSPSSPPIINTQAKDDPFARLVSPPKVLDRIRRLHPRWSQIEAEENAAMRSVGLSSVDCPGISRTASTRRRVSHRLSSLLGGTTPTRAPSDEISDELDFLARIRTPTSQQESSRPPRKATVERKSPGSDETIRITPVRRTPSNLHNKRLRQLMEDSPTRRASMPHSTSMNIEAPHLSAIHPAYRNNTAPTAKFDNVPRMLFTSPPHDSSSPQRPASTSHPFISTPFFHPSELEDIMAPLRREFLERKADLCMKAKAAYEQLNNQLTEELPQLIDLR
jgi:hypothetical protein